MIEIPISIPSLLEIRNKKIDSSIDWSNLEDHFKNWFDEMRKTEQNSKWHYEGNVMNHVMLTMEKLMEFKYVWMNDLTEEQYISLFIATLLHDVGKIDCTTKDNCGNWSAPFHAIQGSNMVRTFLWEEWGWAGKQDLLDLRETICLLIELHMKPMHFISLFDNNNNVLESWAFKGYFSKIFSLRLLYFLSYFDNLGRITFGSSKDSLDDIFLMKDIAIEKNIFDSYPDFSNKYALHEFLNENQQMYLDNLYDSTWGEIVLMCGLPGTGKDTWIKNNLPETPVVSLDQIREELNISSLEDQTPVVSLAIRRAKELLRNHVPFVWNATNIRKDTRTKLIRLFENYGARVKIVYLETSLEENLRRNKNRDKAVPEEVIMFMRRRINFPKLHEAHSVEWKCV